MRIKLRIIIIIIIIIISSGGGGGGGGGCGSLVLCSACNPALYNRQLLNIHFNFHFIIYVTKFSLFPS
jgi:hypothetical protein